MRFANPSLVVVGTLLGLATLASTAVIAKPDAVGDANNVVSKDVVDVVQGSLQNVTDAIESMRDFFRGIFGRDHHERDVVTDAGNVTNADNITGIDDVVVGDDTAQDAVVGVKSVFDDILNFFRGIFGRDFHDEDPSYRSYREAPHSCTYCHMYNEHTADDNGHLLRCLCMAPDASWPTLHLNNHIRNENGQLKWGGCGHRTSCKNFVLHAEHIYQAQCEDDQGRLNFTQIDLDPFIIGNLEPVPIRQA